MMPQLGPPGANPPPQPLDTSPPPDDTVITEMPTQKIENSRAVFSGLDKITGRIISFDAAIGETVQFGALQVTARVCYTRPPTEASRARSGESSRGGCSPPVRACMRSSIQFTMFG
jgi:hypothetical protein